MSIESVLTRIAEIDQGTAGRPTPAANPAGATSFSEVLNGQQALGVSSLAPPIGATATTAAGGTGAGQRALAAAQAEVGVTEQPPGSNDSPRIAQYRQATAGSGVGPWCAYFVSWAAQQAGAPLGESGQGFGSVSALAGWAQRTGRFTPAGAGARPNPGDLIVWGGEHVGIVESVDPDGTLHTIEGNSSNMVTRRTHGADGDGATGFVSLG